MRYFLFAWLLAVALCGPGLAQEQPTATPTASVSATPVPLSVPLSEIAPRLESDREIVLRVRQEAQDNPYLTELDEHLTALEALQGPDASRLAQDDLREVQSQWDARDEQLRKGAAQLEARAQTLDRDIAQVEQLLQAWQVTLAEPTVPAELLPTIREFVRELQACRKVAVDARSGVLLASTRIARQQSRIRAVVAGLSEARQQQVQDALRTRAEPIWHMNLRREFSPAGLAPLFRSWQRQLSELALYTSVRSERFLLHGVALVALLLGLRWMRRKVDPWVEHEPALQRSAAAFSAPFLTALLLTVFFNRAIYPEAPLALRVVLGALAVIPAGLLLRRVLDQALLPLLQLLMVLFLVDELRLVTSAHVLLTRLLFNLEVLAACFVLAWTIPGFTHYRWIAAVCRGALGTLAVALLISNVGFVELGYLLGGAVLRSAYVAAFLYAFLQILEGLFMVALRTPPLSLLHLVREHRPLWRRRFRQFSSFLAAFLWALSFLDQIALRAPVVAGVDAVFRAGLHLGALHITLVGVLALVLTVWIAYQLSQFLQFALEQDVYPRTNLNRGVSYTLSTLLHYLVLSIGVLVGLAGLGIDTTKFVVVAGALGVGIGFGLQNIVNNFVSGLILLFERPVQVGDLVEIADRKGTLQRIGLRASVVRTFDGSDVIVPNGEMLANQVTNWTSVQQRRRLVLAVGAAYGTDPDRVIKVLHQVASSHPDVAGEPAVEAVFLAFGESSLNFELRCWTDQFPRWPLVHSELMCAIYREFNLAGIEIPYPQRVVHIVHEPGHLQQGEPG